MVTKSERDRLGLRTRPAFRSISHEITEHLRDLILLGQLAPGQQVTQDELAQRLGVSTMPVREALLKLAHEGLVEGRRGRSYQIARTTKQDIADVYWVHASLAGELTRRACSRADETTCKALLEIVENWSPAVERTDALLLESLNFEFHRLINVAADSSKLLLLLRHTLRFIPEHFYSVLPAWVALSEEGHREIVAAFVDNDPDRAGAAASRHVQEAGELLISYFDESGIWTHPNNQPPV